MEPCKIVVLALVALLGAPAVGAAEKTAPAAVKPLKKKKPGQKVRAPPAGPAEAKEKPKTSTAALPSLPALYVERRVSAAACSGACGIVAPDET
jgi:hypothetical protein